MGVVISSAIRSHPEPINLPGSSVYIAVIMPTDVILTNQSTDSLNDKCSCITRDISFDIITLIVSCNDYSFAILTRLTRVANIFIVLMCRKAAIQFISLSERTSDAALWSERNAVDEDNCCVVQVSFSTDVTCWRHVIRHRGNRLLRMVLHHHSSQVQCSSSTSYV